MIPQVSNFQAEKAHRIYINTLYYTERIASCGTRLWLHCCITTDDASCPAVIQSR
jgi:hypothetical protein